MDRNRRAAFTLIELLIVMVVVGVLAAIAVPRFSAVKEKAYLTAMKSDLRNLATYEESFAADSAGLYFSGTASGATAVQGFTASQNVTVTATAVSGPPPSWSGAASHTLTSRTCSLSSSGLISCT